MTVQFHPCLKWKRQKWGKKAREMYHLHKPLQSSNVLSFFECCCFSAHLNHVSVLASFWLLSDISHTQVLIFSHIVWEFRVTLCEFKQNYHYSSFRAIPSCGSRGRKSTQANMKGELIRIQMSSLLQVSAVISPDSKVMSLKFLPGRLWNGRLAECL